MSSEARSPATRALAGLLGGTSPWAYSTGNCLSHLNLFRKVSRKEGVCPQAGVTQATLRPLRHSQMVLCDDSWSGGGRFTSFKLVRSATPATLQVSAESPSLSSQQLCRGCPEERVEKGIRPDSGPYCPLPWVPSFLWLLCFPFCRSILWWPSAGPELGTHLSRWVCHLLGLTSRGDFSLNCFGVRRQGGELTVT